MYLTLKNCRLAEHDIYFDSPLLFLAADFCHRYIYKQHSHGFVLRDWSSILVTVRRAGSASGVKGTPRYYVSTLDSHEAMRSLPAYPIGRLADGSDVSGLREADTGSSPQTFQGLAAAFPMKRQLANHLHLLGLPVAGEAARTLLRTLFAQHVCVAWWFLLRCSWLSLLVAAEPKRGVFLPIYCSR